MKSVHLRAIGRVQGVGFRYMTKMVADQLKVTGWVRNSMDGSVEIEAQAEDAVLDQFVQKIRSSPSPSGKVTRLSVSEIPNFSQKGFIVKY
ncbi:acylphosphatase [Pediococcus argentinicus]|uniref:acylphosphatase n=1 Tax=Pediococcus argentinicus TaxID=480391 RepID=A0A0R2NHT9_9LACO|nr:acylphosphatase [Pediococcus argentinicus]KRO25374.1 hypothetical protein IV88_GL000211 [Pediococcus argentinicus]NKZ22292.1 acylphosphatase [Pediococcus argentinicus]GEP19343.1 acylphosphatase [Pediococcus argentinicus]